MKKALVLMLGLALLMTCQIGNTAQVRSLENDVDSNDNPFGFTVIPVGRVAQITGTNSGTFNFTSTKYLHVQVDADPAKIDTVTIYTGKYDAEEVATYVIGNKLAAIGCYAKRYVDKDGNEKVRLIANSNSGVLQVLDHITGAETIFGLTTTAQSSTPPAVRVTLVDDVTKVSANESVTIKYQPSGVLAGMTTLPAGSNLIGKTYQDTNPVHSEFLVLDTMDDSSVWATDPTDTCTLADTYNHAHGATAIAVTKGTVASSYTYCSRTLSSQALVGYGHGDGRMDMWVDSVTDLDYVFIRMGADEDNYAEWQLDGDEISSRVWMSFTGRLGEYDTYKGTGLNDNDIDFLAVGFKMDANANLTTVIFDHLIVYKLIHQTTKDEGVGGQVRIRDWNSNKQADVIDMGTYHGVGQALLDKSGNAVGYETKVLVSENSEAVVSTTACTAVEVTSAATITLTGNWSHIDVVVGGTSGHHAKIAFGSNENYANVYTGSSVAPYHVIGQVFTGYVIKVSTITSGDTVSIYGWGNP